MRYSFTAAALAWAIIAVLTTETEAYSFADCKDRIGKIYNGTSDLSETISNYTLMHNYTWNGTQRGFDQGLYDSSGKTEPFFKINYEGK